MTGTIVFRGKQERCLDSEAKNLLLSGGFRSGKTLAACVKMVLKHCTIPNKEILIWRLTYRELSDTVQKDFFKILPPEWIKSWNKSEGNLRLTNNTLVMFRHLDNVSEFELRGMTLGAALIDQCEEITEEVYKTLSSRVSLAHVPCRQIVLTSNPALFWAYKIFKQEKINDSNYELIEFSMLDNKEHLTEDYLAEQLSRPETWKRQFVHGIWDENLLAERAAIPSEYIQEQAIFTRKAKSRLDDILIYESVNHEHVYQLGVDVSEGTSNDFSAISGFDCGTGEQVCSWRGKVPPDVLATKVALASRHFVNARIIPEVNGVGLALLTKLKELNLNIYRRKQYDKATDKHSLILGWKTTMATKPLMIDNFLKMLRAGDIKIRDEIALNEMKTFVYTTESRKHGVGAEVGFFDDVLISVLLALYELKINIVHQNVKAEPMGLRKVYV